MLRHAGLALALSVLSACSGNKPVEEVVVPKYEVRDGKVFIPEGSPLRERLKVAPATVENLQRHLVAPAQVEAVPSRMARISPPLPGRVVKLHVRFGDSVTQGQPLFALDSPDLVSAQSDYLKAQSSFAVTERNVARQKDLLDHGISSQREYELALAERDSARSELERTRTRLRLLGMGAGSVGGPLTVVSPLTGRVIDLSTAPGQFQNDPAAVLMIVADLSTVWITASVQEKDLRRVAVGDEASAAFAAYPGEKFGGSVLFVGDLLDPDTRTVKVRMELPNGESRFKPGMFATVTFQSKAAPEIIVPAQAVVVTGEKSSMYVETAPWTFERRTVEVGETVGDRIEVTKGIEAGVRIVTFNTVLLP